MVLSLLFKPRELIAVIKLMREAKRRGVDVEDISPEDIARTVLPKARPEHHGLPADHEVTTTPPDDDPAAAAVKADVQAGNWRTAADFVASTVGDWDRRQRIVWTLADLAAKDDTWLRAWASERPDDPNLPVVHSLSLVSLAWDIRGGQRGSDTTREQFAGFHRVLEEALEAAKFAVAAMPEDPTPWNTIATLGRGLGFDHETFETVWSELTARDPLHHNGHHQALQYWCRKWHGSHELAMDFALRAAARSPKFAVLPLKATYEMADDVDEAWRQPAVVAALDTLVARLADEGADSAAVREDRSYAILALIGNQRFEEALAQYRALGTHADTAPWSYFKDPRATFLLTRLAVVNGYNKSR